MTAPQFLALTTTGKKNYLQSIEHTSERYEPDFTVLLYYIDGLCIEVFHHRRLGVIQIDCTSNNKALKAHVPLPQTMPETVYTQPAGISKAAMTITEPQPGWFKKLSNMLQHIKGALASRRSVTHL